MFSIKIYENLILFIKVIIIILLLFKLYYHFIGHDNDIKNKKIKKWENRFSFFLTFLIALFIIYLFLPGTNRKIDHNAKITLFLFAVLTIVRLDWYTFLHDIFYSNQ